MEINTHLNISKELCGTPIKIEKDYCLVELSLNDSMKVDKLGLIHGSFIFGAADYAAMLAVNHPNVVLGSADVKFLKPSKVNDAIFAEAVVTETKNNKKIVSVSVKSENKEIFKGTFVCFILEKHVLAN
jgi:acyl-coenzyme A thioesterase PaaI-like protein